MGQERSPHGRGAPLPFTASPVEYTDARCGRCGTWRTALVGYGGARVCLACGEALDRPGETGSLVRLSAAAGLDRLWPGGEPAGSAGRGARLRAWLDGQSVSLPEAYVAVLAHCERASEVRFALPLVTLSTWRPVGQRSFSDGSWTLRLQHPLGGRRVDFVLEGPGASRPVAIEVDPAEGEGDARRELLDSLALRAAGYPVLRVPADLATERGVALRGAFMREALEVVERETAPGAREAPPAPRTRRLWSRHELVYDATGLPVARRRELVEDWLRSRGERPEAWQLDFLSHCERAAEVHFALPFLRLPGAEPAAPRTVHLDPWHALSAQAVVEGHAADFAFLASRLPAGGVSTVLVEIHPARGPRDREAETHRGAAWRSLGHAVVELSAAEAGGYGRRWAATLRGETGERRALDAG